MSTRFFSLFFFNDTATPEIYTLSLHDALPISPQVVRAGAVTEQHQLFLDAILHVPPGAVMFFVQSLRCPCFATQRGRSEEHTSELQSQSNLVCRLLLEKKKKANTSLLPGTDSA